MSKKKIFSDFSWSFKTWAFFQKTTESKDQIEQKVIDELAQNFLFFTWSDEKQGHWLNHDFLPKPFE